VPVQVLSTARMMLNPAAKQQKATAKPISALIDVLLS
jgi:hypothetical protein